MIGEGCDECWDRGILGRVLCPKHAAELRALNDRRCEEEGIPEGDPSTWLVIPVTPKVAGDGVVACIEAHDDTDRANAVLIAKAPEMAAMLRELEPAMKEHVDNEYDDLTRRLSQLLKELP